MSSSETTNSKVFIRKGFDHQVTVLAPTGASSRLVRCMKCRMEMEVPKILISEGHSNAPRYWATLTCCRPGPE